MNKYDLYQKYSQLAYQKIVADIKQVNSEIVDASLFYSSGS